MNGQRCTAGSRLLVQESAVRADRRSGRRTGAQHPGRRPVRPRTELGPLIHPEHHARVLDYIASAREEGARVLAGGGRPEHLPRRQLPGGDGDRRRRRDDARLPGGDLRAGPRGHAVPRRGRRRPPGQRHALRPGRLRLDERPAASAPRRARDRHRHVLGQLAERARPAHAVRRREGQRHRPRRRRLRLRLLLRDRDRPHRAGLASHPAARPGRRAQERRHEHCHRAGVRAGRDAARTTSFAPRTPSCGSPTSWRRSISTSTCSG